MSKIKPNEPEYVNLSTEVTDEDLAKAWTDEFGVLYSKDRKRLLKYKNHSIKEYTIKPGTIVICKLAFYLPYKQDNGVCFDHFPLSKIHIPDSVTHIGDCAFSSCESLSEIHIPDSVTHIGDCAFSSCESLSEIHIPNSVTKIGKFAYFGCSSLTSISVDRENKYYDSRNNCNAIIETKSNKLVVGSASTIIPDSVTEIGRYSFYCCYSLSEIHIPNSVTKIGCGAFYGCSSLSEIHIPDSVTKIEYAAFYGCSSLSEIHIPNSVTKITKWVFCRCKSLSKIHIPDSVTYIGDTAFWCCYSLSEIHIPNSVTKIGKEVFTGCNSLTKIVIPTGSRSKFEEILPSSLRYRIIEKSEDNDI